MNGAVEACFLIGEGGGVLWAERSADPAALPDSRARWEAVWRHRDELSIVAHSHPGGLLAFSATDHSTMEALDAALGRALDYAVVTPEAMVRCGDGEVWIQEDEPWWTWLLRIASGIAIGQPARTHVVDDDAHHDEEEEEEPTWRS